MKIRQKINAWFGKVWKELQNQYRKAYEAVVELLREVGVLPKSQEGEFPQIEPQADLPQEYLDQFLINPLDDPERLRTRQAELEKIRKAKDAGIALLVSGESGAGMTSLLQVAAAGFEKVKFLKNNVRVTTRKKLIEELAKALKLKEVTTIDDLIKRVPEKPPVLIFENIERLYLRQIGGFNLLNDFLYIISQTSAAVTWIVSINNYSQYYLDKAIDLSSNFFYSISLTPLPLEALREELLTRNGHYEVVFLKPNDMPRRLRRKLSKADPIQKQVLLGEYFFTRLERFAKGNISRALMWWVRSVVRVHENRAYLLPYEHREEIRPDYDELFVIEAFLQHASLSAGDLSKVLELPGRKAEVYIAKMLERGWIFPLKRTNPTKEYQVNLLYFTELKTALLNNLNRKI